MAMSEEKKREAAERMRAIQAQKKADKEAAEAKKTAEAAEEVTAEDTHKAAEDTPKTEDAKVFTQEEVDAMIARAVALAIGENQPKVIQVSGDTERVYFLWQAPVSDDNVFEVAGGLYGHIVGKTGTFSVPKAELSRAMDNVFRLLMEKRWIIVLSGVTDEERAALGADYKGGEILDKGAFAHLAQMGDEILSIYPALCEGHREIVQKNFYEAWQNGSKTITRARTTALKEMADALGDKDSAFRRIIEEMNAQDAE